MIRRFLLSLTVAGLVAGCGSSEDRPQAAAATSTPTSSPTAAPEPQDECVAKGITSGDNSGRCTGDDGVEFVVARRAGTVALNDASLRLVKSYVTKEVPSLDSAGAPGDKAQGRFAIFKLRVKNLGSSPQQWASGLGWAALVIGGTTYSPEDGTAAFTKGYTVDGDPGLESGELQAGQTKTAWVAFDIKTADAAVLRSAGSSLAVVAAEDAINGNNAAAGTASQRGSIQLWR